MPILLFALGMAFLVFSLPQRSIVGVLLGAGAVAMAAGEFRVLTSVDDRLVIRGLRRRLALDRAETAFAVRLQTSWRSARYIVVATDGSVSDEVAEFMSEGNARRAIARLEASLATTSGRRAAAIVRSIEKPWKANVAEGQKIIDAYYASPSWRRAKYGVIGLVILYSLAMLLYGALRG